VSETRGRAPEDRRFCEANRQDGLAEDKAHARGRYALARLYLRIGREILAETPTDADILEIGCGVGTFLAQAVGYTSGRVIGIDVSSRNVSLASDAVDARGEVIAADVQDGIPLADARVDLVVMQGVVHHLMDPARVFADVHRVLRERGRLVLVEGNPQCAYRLGVLGLADLLRIRHEAGRFRHASMTELMGMIEDVGLCAKRAETLPGCWAPLAYAGFGGPRMWRVLDRIERLLYRMGPRCWGWWLMITAQKPEAGP